VRFFRISDEDGTAIAGFYLDPYSRPQNKRGGAWMGDCLSRRLIEGRLQLPVAHLVCNSTPPVGNKPSLMTFREVETLFHEFGHGLQHMLTKVNYADAAGISGIEWDAVELPSQFMENWCYHRPTLIGMTAHYETGEPLPEELFQKICAARTFRSGSMMLRQLTFGMTDMELHSNYDPDGPESVFDVQRRVSEKTSVLPSLPEDRSLCSFQHIFAGGYAAGYYSYKWAEVLSADAFSAFEEAGLDNERAIAETGRRFRDTVLALGGGRHPMDVFKDFRGREPSAEPLLRHSGLKA
jgi:oligopeptidase A